VNSVGIRSIRTSLSACKTFTEADEACTKITLPPPRNESSGAADHLRRKRKLDAATPQPHWHVRSPLSTASTILRD
jgi:hypothetical protein